MNIAIFTDLYLPQVNGVVTHIIETARMLSKEHKIIIFAPKPALLDESKEISVLDKKIKIIQVPSAPLPIYQKMRITLPHNPFVFEKLNAFKPDIIHFHTPGTVAINGILYAKNKHIPLLGTFHGYFMEPEYLAILGLDKIGLHTSKKLNSLLWNFAKYFYGMADALLCPSEQAKKDLMKHGIKKPVHIISNGIDLEPFRLKNNHGPNFILPQHYFLHVGRLSKEKSIPDVLRAFSKCAKSIPADLIIVGDGPQRDDLTKLTQELGLKDRVHFMGEIEHDRLIHSNIHRNAIAFITASTSETQGIAILEAMASRLPIIGVRARAIPELITNNGICCRPHNIKALAEAMTTLYTDKTKRAQYAKNSYKNVKYHSLQKTVTKLTKIFAGLGKTNI